MSKPARDRAHAPDGDRRRLPRARGSVRAVAIPGEHGGWGLTAEPVLLGILVAPSVAGAALAIAALAAFLARTPLEVVLVDRFRHRWLARSRLAALIVTGEIVIIAGLAAVAWALAGWRWLLPVAFAAPLVAIELWFDMRSRGRRLVPELCGAVGVAAAAASVALAGGAGTRLAVGLWMVLAARAVAAIPFVRVQIDRLRHGDGAVGPSDRAQAAGALVAIAAVITDPALAAGAAAVGALLVAHLVWVRRPPVPAKVLGLRQMLLGLAVVAVTAAGVLA